MRSVAVLVVAGFVLAFDVPASTCMQATCAGSEPTAAANTILGGPVVSLRTPDDPLNRRVIDGVTFNDVEAIFSGVTVAAGTSLKRRLEDLSDFGEVPLPSSIVGTSPIVRLDDGSLHQFVTRTDAGVSAIHLAAMVPSWSVSHRRAGCGSDSIDSAPVVHLRRLATDDFRNEYSTDLVYAGTALGSAGGAPCSGASVQNQVRAHRATDGATVWAFNSDGLTPVDIVVGMVLDRTEQTITNAGSTTTTAKLEDTLFVATERTASVNQHSLYAVNALNGTLRWSHNYGRMIIGPVLSKQQADRLYAINRSGQLHALRKSDGTPIWSLGTGLVVVQAIATNETGAEQRIVTVDAFGRLAMFRDNGTNGELIWLAEIPAGPIPVAPPALPPVRASSVPLLDDAGHLFVGGSDGRVYQLNPETGHILAVRVVDDDLSAAVEHVVVKSPATDAAPAVLCVFLVRKAGDVLRALLRRRRVHRGSAGCQRQLRRHRRRIADGSGCRRAGQRQPGRRAPASLRCS